jgi:hypothetical protein
MCAYGFEANPRFTKLLTNVSKSLQRRFARLEIFTETAVVGTSDSVVHLELKPGDPAGIGTSVHATSGAMSKLRGVRAWNLVDWLRSVAVRHLGVPIVLRMDIEGAE